MFLARPYFPVSLAGRKKPTLTRIQDLVAAGLYYAGMPDSMTIDYIDSYGMTKKEMILRGSYQN